MRDWVNIHSDFKSNTAEWSKAQTRANIKNIMLATSVILKFSIISIKVVKWNMWN